MFGLIRVSPMVTLDPILNTELKMVNVDEGRILIKPGTFIIPCSGGQETDGFRVFIRMVDSDKYCNSEFRLSFDDALEFAFVEYARMLAAEVTENLVLERGHFSP